MGVGLGVGVGVGVDMDLDVRAEVEPATEVGADNGGVTRAQDQTQCPFSK